MDKKLYIIIGLAILAGILTYIRENRSPASTFEASTTSKQELREDRLQRMSDSTLVKLGIEKRNIRPIKNKNDVRVYYPVGFDVLRFVKALNDSLSDYNATVTSIENSKERTSVVQIKTNDAVLKSYIFNKAPLKVEKKGVSPLVKKRTK